MISIEQDKTSVTCLNHKIISYHTCFLIENLNKINPNESCLLISHTLVFSHLPHFLLEFSNYFIDLR